MPPLRFPLRRAASPLLLAGGSLALHLPFLAPSLEDIDSINFALGLHDFDVAAHQPHPPGYPVYIAMGRLSSAVLARLAPSLDLARSDALALAFWSAVAGVVALLAAHSLFAALAADGFERRTGSAPRGHAIWATALLAVAPLFWMSGLRPLSDLPGLAAALSSQALLVAGFRQPRALILGALLTGVTAGIRVQSLALTMPLLLIALVQQRHAGVIWMATRPALALGAGMAVWLLPLLAASRGIDGYVSALGAQAGEDFAWVDMVWANPTPRRIALSLYETFAMPWSTIPLAIPTVGAAVIGLALAMRSQPRGLLILAAGFGGYAVFHILLQETLTVRYALPVLVPMAWLAARGALAIAPRGIAAAALVAGAAVVSLPAAAAYGREAHPAFRAIADMRERAASMPPAAIHAHYALRRALQESAPPGVTVVEPRRGVEWLGLVDYWRGGGTRPVWFLADPRRTDLDLIDPHARTAVRYDWAVGARPEFSGTRPLSADWYALSVPMWFAGEGWSLTPETGGIVQATRAGPHHRPIVAYVRRSAKPMKVMVGGGHVGGGGAAAVFDLEIDGALVESWTLPPSPAATFLRFIDLPAGIGNGAGLFASLTITARAARSGAPAPPVAIRQFDAQPAGTVMHGFADGWYEQELEPATGRRWRWTSERATLRIDARQSVRLTIQGESPLRYLDAPPRVRVLAGDRELDAFEPAADFRRSVTIDAGTIAAAAGAIEIETAQVYLPSEVEGSADTRRLGLRLFDIAVHPVSP